MYTNVEGNFATGKIEHNLLLGIDLNHTQTDVSSRFDPFPLEPSNPNLSFINIFKPDYDAFPAPDAETIDFLNNDDVTNDRLGIYLQDKIDLLDNLILLAGLRYDTFDQTITNNLTNTEVSQDSDAFTPRIGIVYQPIEAISLYTNYSQSFNPKPFLYNRSIDGSLLEPESGEGFEVGVKADLVPNRLAATILWTTYEIQQGDLEGLGLGIGLNYVGERQGGLPNSFEADSYFLTNAALFYNRQNWQLRLNFNNLFDVDFIETVNTSSVRDINPGRPFQVRGSIAVQL